MTTLRPFKFRAVDPAALNAKEIAPVSCLGGKENVVAEGDDAGLTFAQLVEKYKGEILGDDMYKQYGNEYACSIALAKADNQYSLAADGFNTENLVVDDTYDMYMTKPHAFKVLVCTKGWVVITDDTGKEMRVEEGDTVVVPAATGLIVLDSYADFLVANPA